jgi:DNA-binding transcriptional ArsR family regulator
MTTPSPAGDVRVPGSEPGARPEGGSRALTLEPGPWEPEAATDVKAYLVVRGLLLRDVGLGTAPASDLLGPGDAIACQVAEDALLAPATSFHVIIAARLLPVDGSLQSVRPSTLVGLLRRAVEQERRQATHRAIAQLPRVEDRLLALFWHLAERHGRVSANGVTVPLALRHELLGRLVGAARPTVSLALKDLAERGLVHREDAGTWLLRNEGLELLRGTPTERREDPGLAPLPVQPRTPVPDRVPDAPVIPPIDREAIRMRIDALRGVYEREVKEVAAVIERARDTQTAAARTRRTVQATRHRLDRARRLRPVQPRGSIRTIAPDG